MHQPSNDSKCPCHPAIRKPDPPSLQLILRGPQETDITHLNQPNTELDVHFDFLHQALQVKETIKDPIEDGIAHSVRIQFDSWNSQFANLEGTPDGSLLLSLRMLESACAVRGSKLHPQEKRYRFVQVESALYDRLALCEWRQKTVQLLLPAARIRGWKTVALILLTFNRISLEKWCDLVNMKGEQSVAGLDWRQVEEEWGTMETRKDKHVAGDLDEVMLEMSDEVTEGYDR